MPSASREHAVPGLSWVLYETGDEFHVIPEADYLKGHRRSTACTCEPIFVDECWVHNERPTA